MKTEKATALADRTLFLWAGILYVAVVALAVVYSWVLSIHRFDLSLTVSLYVGLHIWTSVLYFLAAVAICALLGWYVRKTPIPPVRRTVHLLTLFCVLACALFPCNGARSALSENIHNYFSYALVILLAVSFLLLAVSPGKGFRKCYGLGSTLFALFFIAAFVLKFRAFKDTIFLWENGIIVLWFYGLYLERP